MISSYPEFDPAHCFPDSEEKMHSLMDAIRAIRNRRAEMNVPPSKKARIYIETNEEKTFLDGKAFLCKLAYANEIEVGKNFTLEGAVTIVTANAKIYIPMDELIDKKAELKRLSKELEEAKKQFSQSEGKLRNAGFLQKAPQKVVEGVKETAAKLQEKIQMIESTMKSFS